MSNRYNHTSEKIPVHNNGFNLSNLDRYKGKDGRFHYLYKIVNLINNKYYYGIHTTEDLDDNYMGSGEAIHNAYKKYGLKNFLRCYVEFFDDRKSMLNREKEIVNADLIKNIRCYNLALGGIGTEHPDPHTTKGKIHINDGIKNKLIREKELKEYLSNGWKLGQTHKSNEGKVVIHRNNEELFVSEKEMAGYIEDGWIRGGKSRNKGQKSFAKGCIWINNGEKCKRINPEELEKYISQGWKRGAIQRYITGYIRITNGKEDKNISPENEELLQHYLDLGWKRGSHTKHNDKCWVSKGNESKRINKEELQHYLDLGWKRGNININKSLVKTNKGKIVISSPDHVIKHIFPEELQYYIERGWIRGNIKTSGRSIGKGKIRVNNDDVTLTINPEDLQKYINLGWKKGMIHNVVTKGRYRITNGQEERFVTPEDYESNYDHTTWKRGLIRSRKLKKQKII